MQGREKLLNGPPESGSLRGVDFARGESRQPVAL